MISERAWLLSRQAERCAWSAPYRSRTAVVVYAWGAPGPSGTWCRARRVPRSRRLLLPKSPGAIDDSPWAHADENMAERQEKRSKKQRLGGVVRKRSSTGRRIHHFPHQAPPPSISTRPPLHAGLD